MSSQKVTTKGGKNLDPPKKKNPTESLVWALGSDVCHLFSNDKFKVLQGCVFPVGRSTMGYAGMPVQKCHFGRSH